MKELLRRALALRDRHAVGKVSRHGLAVARGQLAVRLRRLVECLKKHPANERFAKFLEQHQHALLTFLEFPGSDATNWRAEQTIRPAVVNRKVWGGNRTWQGAAVQGLLMSVLRTLTQRQHEPLDWLARTLCATKPPELPAVGR